MNREAERRVPAIVTVTAGEATGAGGRPLSAAPGTRLMTHGNVRRLEKSTGRVAVSPWQSFDPGNSS
jgi:hypothetical protein